ncbi:hypothetical protein BY996DRAFT_6528791 [Phakopsora pachyrhizi]|nr:hypothetical protein BY996DRAFT_6528791 [Phakopsora pachyrhizi]
MPLNVTFEINRSKVVFGNLSSSSLQSWADEFITVGDQPNPTTRHGQILTINYETGLIC